MDIAQDPTRLRPMEISSVRTHSLLLYRPPVQPRRSSFGLGTTLETGLLPASLRLGLRRSLINFPVGGPDRVSLYSTAPGTLRGGGRVDPSRAHSEAVTNSFRTVTTVSRY